MTLEEYAVEKIKTLENKVTELESALKMKSEEYKAANSSIRKLREENENFKKAIGRNVSLNNCNLERSGCVYISLSDSYKSGNSNLTEKEAQVREDFDFLCKVINEYKETHPEKKDSEEEGDLLL